jgi:hypothetical protein
MTAVRNDDRKLTATVLLLDDRSAISASAARPQKQRCREHRLRPAVQLLLVEAVA